MGPRTGGDAGGAQEVIYRNSLHILINRSLPLELKGCANISFSSTSA